MDRILIKVDEDKNGDLNIKADIQGNTTNLVQAIISTMERRKDFETIIKAAYELHEKK